jgi:hypothetical protein
MKASLINQLGSAQGDSRFGRYSTARECLITDVLPEIARKQPSLTDHGPDHVKNVLDNVHALMGDETPKLAGMELYCLLLSILFHDVGNIIDRKQHQAEVSPIYDFVFPRQTGHQDAEEKLLILEICAAHCGKAVDGTNDTLQYVRERSKLEGCEIKPAVLAPILRFADELAEGEHRTSSYMIAHHNYASNSLLFHRYANCSSTDIDRPNGRIRLSYHIRLNPLSNMDHGGPDRTGNTGIQNNGIGINVSDLAPFLEFIYRRVEKLNQERQYAKHYCSFLDPFKRTTVTIDFLYENQPLAIELQQAEISDLVVPGDPYKSVIERYPAYEPSRICDMLEKAILEVTSYD